MDGAGIKPRPIFFFHQPKFSHRFFAAVKAKLANQRLLAIT
jgi:hypothetical protein